MLKWLKVSALGLVSAAALYLAMSAPALADPPVQYIGPLPITATGIAWQVSLNGDAACQVKITGSPVGLNMTVKTSVSPDGNAGYDNAVAIIGSNTITSASNNIFAVANSGLGAFQLNVTAYTSGGTSLYAICGPPSIFTSGSASTNVNIIGPLDGSGNVLVDCAVGCNTAASGSTLTVLTSASPTSCTAIKTGATVLKLIWNSGPTMVVFPKFFGDNATCGAGVLLYGDGTTLVIGAGQILTFSAPVAALSYTLSGALTSNLWIVTTP